ncbi:MAG: L-threonylcarbamoyladenylate synthase [Candidatus Pacebacteria bacterium]|nr:L-threonylcarbamoyladenylate synthase [Candidatus Paceibacterota bacterium]
MARVNQQVINILKSGGVGVLPTDTLYGLVGSALNKKAVERIYGVKKRDKSKKMIVLIASQKDLQLFKIKLNSRTKKFLKKAWPNPVSVILSLSQDEIFNKTIAYLHRDSDTLAFRVPKPRWLRRLLKKTGPLVAPSANPDSLPPAENIEQAKNYFGANIDFYVNAGQLTGEPSTIVKPNETGLEIRRQGAVKI